MILIIKFLLSLMIFILPLIGANKNLGYEQIKVFVFIIILTFICFLWLFLKPKIKLTNIRFAALLFFGSLVVTSFSGLNPLNSFTGVYPYFQGWVLYSYLFLFSLLISWINIKLETYAKILSVGSIIVAGLALKDWVLLEYFHQVIPNYAGRVVSSFGQPNFYAGFLLLNLPFSYFLFKNSNKTLSFLGLFAGFISVAGIFVSYSRSAILIALILITLGLIDQLKIKIRFLIIAGVTIFISCLIALKFSSGFLGNEISLPLASKNPDLTRQGIEKRVYIYPQAIKIFLESPFLGYGLENISNTFVNYFKVHKHAIFEENLKIEPVLISLKDLYIDRTHNFILDLLLFSGVFGVVTWVILVFLIFKKILTSKISLENNALLLGLITYVIWIQFQNQSIMQLIYFWLLVGLIDKEG